MRIMEWKEYLKEMINKVDNQEEDGARLGLYINEDTQFLYHEDCFADFHDDFVIIYDKKAKVNMSIPYANITMTQYTNKEQLKDAIKEISIEDLFKKLIED